MSNDAGNRLLQDALLRVLEPMARLALAQGLPFAQAEELLKQAFVRAARDARRAAGAPASRDVSQVSVATGINRREVSRITAQLRPPQVQRPAPATRVFLRWVADQRLRGRDGRPLALPRTGPAPSFEHLARAVTREVHPRSLLDELCRLGLAQLSPDGETVRLLKDRFIPAGDDPRLLGFVGQNVGDHMAAAADNVRYGDRRHLEQAIYTDELSEQAVQALAEMAQQQWQRLLAEVVPAIERLIAEDQAAGRPATRRARLGLYSYQESLPEVNDEP